MIFLEKIGQLNYEFLGCLLTSGERRVGIVDMLSNCAIEKTSLIPCHSSSRDGFGFDGPVAFWASFGGEHCIYNQVIDVS